MARPCCCRRIEGKPISSVFKPKGIPRPGLGEITITLDEFEAVRLADLEGLYQEQAAVRMEVSRPTFSRIIESARRKIATALIQGQILKIEGGTVYAAPPDVSRCRRWPTVNTDSADNVITKDGKSCCGRRRPSDCKDS